jgi:signal transduction histidine kinase
VTSRQLGVDAALAVAVSLVVCALMSIGLPGGSRPVDAGAYLFAAALGSLLLLRRRAPLAVLMATATVLILYHAVGYPPVGLAVPGAVAFYSAAEAGRTGWSAGTALGLFGLSTAVRLLQGGAPGIVLGYDLPINAGLLAMAVALGAMVHARRGWQAEIERRTRAVAAERAAEAAHRLDQERVRVARELHDDIAHRLSVISIHAALAAETVHDDPVAAETAVRTIADTGRAALAELRLTVAALRTGGDEADASTAGLDELGTLVESAAGAGLRVDVERHGDLSGLPPVVSVAARRVLQESITNVLRHAAARRAGVTLRRQPGLLRVRVSDDGHGGVDTGDGFGIRGMRERVALLGGTLSAGPAPDGGFVVEASIPVPDLR